MNKSKEIDKWDATQQDRVTEADARRIGKEDGADGYDGWVPDAVPPKFHEAYWSGHASAQA